MKARLKGVVKDITEVPSNEELVAALEAAEGSDADTPIFDEGLGLLPQNLEVSKIMNAANASERTACKVKSFVSMS